MGVGAREISYIFGQYKHMTREFTGVLTGKGLSFGGSRIRAEATGYGCVFIMEKRIFKALNFPLSLSLSSNNIICNGAKRIRFIVKRLNSLQGTIYKLFGKRFGFFQSHQKRIGVFLANYIRPHGLTQKCRIAFHV
jgi:hypothetical protein